MRLLRLSLENFQGIRKVEFDFSGSSGSIYGDNATGKTTIFNAFTWLLFDKASTGAKNFTPKTKNESGDVHYLEHSAEALIEVNGSNITLKKVFKESYKKRRGAVAEEFDGHVVEYYINGVPHKEKEYTAAVMGLCGDAERMKVLTMPDYFSEAMSWDARRMVLLEACGDITDADVIDSSEELKELQEYLKMPGSGTQSHSVEDYRKIAQAAKSDIRKQIEGIPLRIDEAERAMPDISGFKLEQIEEDLSALNAEKDNLERGRAQILAGGQTESDIRQRIAEVNAELAEGRAAHVEKGISMNSSVNEEIAELRKKVMAAQDAAFRAGAAKTQKRKQLIETEALRDKLIDEYKKIQAELWNDEDNICPSCKQALPGDQIKQHKEQFNLHRSQRLEVINARGKNEANKDMLLELERQVKELDDEAEKQAVLQGTLEREIEKLQQQIIKPRPFEQTTTYANLNARLEELRVEDRDSMRVAAEATAALSSEIQELQNKINAENEKKTAIRTATAQKERIKELMKREKELAAEFEKLEKGLYLCELFMKTKVSLLTEKINSKFKSVRFRLFVEQINGGIKEDCEVMIPAESGQLVPFAFANNAGRINAGLEIIDALSRHWNVEIPVFVDNAESVTRLVEMDTQVIRLVVSEKDKTLRLALDNEVKQKKVA